MKILLTGGAGFIGSHLVEYFTNKKNNDLSVVDNLSSGTFDRIQDFKKKIKFYKINLSDISREVNLNRKFDWVIHCAALAPLPDNQSDHYDSLISNVANCGSLVNWCIQNGNKNIIFLSSSAVYENNNRAPFKESDNVSPYLMYANSKYLAEQYFYAVAKSYNLNVIILRLANVYGKKQDYFRKQPPLIGYLIKCILRNKICNLYAKGSHIRDYIYIDDLSNLIFKIINKKSIIRKKSFFKIFNVGSGNNYSVKDFILVLEKILQKKLIVSWKEKSNYWLKYKNIYYSKIKFKKKLIKKEVEKKVILNLNITKSFFSWKPKVDLLTGMQQCTSYAKKYFKIKNE